MLTLTDAGVLGSTWTAPCGSLLFVSAATAEFDAEAHVLSCEACSDKAWEEDN